MKPAHPRVSGENVSQLTIGEVAYGSSPRERGKQPGGGGLAPPPAAHPRVSGENVGVLGHDMGIGGSSPRERGKRQVKLEVVAAVGLIPA